VTTFIESYSTSDNSVCNYGAIKINDTLMVLTISNQNNWQVVGAEDTKARNRM